MDGEPGGICSDAYEAPTISRIPNPAECVPIAACIPQDKGSGKDSPPLPLTPVHLPPGSPPAIYFTGKGEGGCVTLLQEEPESGTGMLYEIASLSWFRLFFIMLLPTKVSNLLSPLSRY